MKHIIPGHWECPGRNSGGRKIRQVVCVPPEELGGNTELRGTLGALGVHCEGVSVPPPTSRRPHRKGRRGTSAANAGDAGPASLSPPARGQAGGGEAAAEPPGVGSRASQGSRGPGPAGDGAAACGIVGRVRIGRGPHSWGGRRWMLPGACGGEFGDCGCSPDRIFKGADASGSATSMRDQWPLQE